MTRRRGRRLVSALGAAAALAAGVGGGWATTAGNSMPSTNRASATTIAVAASAFKPAACTGTVTSIVDVPAGGSSFSVGTAGTLILGTSGNDSVSATSSGGYECFVGGGPVSSNSDGYGGGPSSSQCVLAASVKSSGIKNCTIVQSSP